jgi:hypothetical protein
VCGASAVGTAEPLWGGVLAEGPHSYVSLVVKHQQFAGLIAHIADRVLSSCQPTQRTHAPGDITLSVRSSDRCVYLKQNFEQPWSLNTFWRKTVSYANSLGRNACA